LAAARPPGAQRRARRQLRAAWAQLGHMHG
jgi:hypothetical protein